MERPISTPSVVRESPVPARAWLALLPLLMAAVALGLRLYGLDWDGGNFYHPDERSLYLRADCMYQVLVNEPGWEGCVNRDFPVPTSSIPSPGEFFDAAHSPLNPHWFPLGSILIYVLVAIRAALGVTMDHVALQDLAAAGRALAAFADAVSVLMLYALGKRVFSRGVGLLAAALFAFSPYSIQLAHFYRPESVSVLLVLAAFWKMLDVHDRGRRRDHAWLGVAVGAGFAVKASSLPLLAPVFVLYLVLARGRWLARGANASGIRGLAGLVTLGVLAAGAAGVAFAVLQPYAVLDRAKFVADLTWEAGIARNAGTVPYTVQYIGAERGWYELRQSSVWALGLPLGIAAWLGLALSLVRVRRGPLGEALLVAWAVPLLLTVMTFEVKFLRYVAPVLPVLTLLGARWLLAAVAWARPRRDLVAIAPRVAAAFVLMATAFFGLAFARTYGSPHPGTQASAWLNANAPAGSTLLIDGGHWDEGFPDLGRFRVDHPPVYDNDSLAKLQTMAQQFADADYFVSYSNRPWGAIARVPERYPHTASFYQRLFDGGLGYQLERAFDRYPSLAGVTFVHDPFTRAGVLASPELPGTDDGALTLRLGYADENVTNYDRPLVLLWRNVQRLPAQQIVASVLAGMEEPARERAMLSPEAAQRQQAGGTWTAIFRERGLERAAPWLVWLIAVETIFLITLPLATAVFRWMPDRGAVLARPLGILLVVWLTWLGASTGVWTFSRGSVALAALIVAIASTLVLVRRGRPLCALARRHWRYLAGTELLFIGAYAAFLLVRAANPDLWHPWRGGDKPMDLSYLTAVVRSTTMPPYDPWYAGGHLNYYYFGQFIIATLMRATGIVPAIAYNLAIALLFALALTAAFAVGYATAESLRQRGLARVSARSTVLAGLTVAALAVVLANIDGAGQVLQGTWRTLNGGPFCAQHLGICDYWRSSRLMPGQIAITEFPFWTFLFADLHAHLIAIPFVLLALGLTVNLVLSAHAPVPVRRRLPAAAALAVSVGALGAINTWDVPASMFLAFAGIGIVVTARAERLTSGTFVRWAIAAAVFGLLQYALFLPFHRAFDSPSTGVFVSKWRTVLWHYLVIHALLFWLVTTWLAVELWRRFRQRPRRLSPGPGAAPAETPPQGPAITLVPARRSLLENRALTSLLLAALLGLLVLLAAQSGGRAWLTVAMLAMLLLGVVALGLTWHRRQRGAAPQLMLLAMTAVAFGIGLGVDLVTVKGDIDRMNTVFKFYLNAWLLFAIVGGVGLWQLWASGALRVRHVRPTTLAWVRRAWLAALAVIVLASSVFFVAGTRWRTADRFNPLPLTLDGAAFMRAAVYTDPGPNDRAGRVGGSYALASDIAALDYLRRHVSGSPIVLEAVTDQYRWTPRVAVYTGLPVVVGWEWHQLQQRGANGDEPAAVRRRIRDVQRLYTTTDTADAMALLRKYNVSYVYVGAVERLYFSPEGIAKFQAMVGAGLDVFYADDAVTVYRVTRASRGAATAPAP